MSCKRICYNCGAFNVNCDDDFCYNCGNELNNLCLNNKKEEKNEKKTREKQEKND